jgi:hypothetical protein
MNSTTHRAGDQPLDGTARTSVKSCPRDDRAIARIIAKYGYAARLPN